jgi:predicted AlkP superfamily pyrophosphatase or phosphodiesterase
MRALPSLFAGLLVLGCGADAPPRANDAGDPPVLLVAVDGFEWNVILPLLRDGRMPATEELMQRGTFGTLRPMKPSKSPRLWTTIATGKPPGEHGILDFTREEDDGTEVLYSSLDRKVKAFWNILTDYGVSNDTIGWWVTFPVEPVHGMMVSQTNTEAFKVLKGSLVDGLPGQVWPAELEPEVFAAFERVAGGLDEWMAEVFGDQKRRSWPAVREKWDQCRWAFRADGTYLAILRSRLERGPPSRVTSLYIGGTDVVGHRFWSAYEPEAFDPAPDRREVELLGDVIESYYGFVDDVLAELIERFPRDTIVFVVADHGMQLGQHDGDEAGVFLAAGPGIRASGAAPRAVAVDDLVELGRLVDVCPTLLELVGVPYGEDMRGRPLETVLEPTGHRLSPVPTHDDAAWKEGRRAGAGVHDAERLEQLRQLGYLGEDE